MSRALRKAQRQQLESLKSARGFDADDSGESDADDKEGAQVPPNPFDLLNVAESDGDDSDALEEDQKAILAADEDEDLQAALAASLPLANSTKPKKKAKKKKNKKGKSESQVKADDHDSDFEAVLNANREALANTVQPEGQQKPFNLAELLFIDVKMLDPNVEMRRLFGSKVVSSERAERISMNRRNMPRGMQQLLNRGRKSVLVPMEDNYPLTIKGGLDMQMEEDLEGIRTFRFVHSKSYQQTELTFMQCVQTGDPQTLMNLLSRAPFHVDTLLQVSEILRHQGDNEQSEEMLTRALFAFDRAFHPLFNIATGLVRLPFEYPENRPFYLAIYRYISLLGRRGCWATAFEFNKLLYALAPEEDPYAALLSIDFYAIKARNWEYLQKLMECPWSQVLDHDFPKPNFDYARALSSLLQLPKNADTAPAQFQLSEAIAHFPYFVRSLFSELKAAGPIQYDAIEPEDEFARLIRDLYVFRAKDIYNTPELTKFLRESALPVDKFDPYALPAEIPMNVCRHILLLDERTLMHYLPKEVTASPGLSFDPLPPADSLPSYLDAYMPSGDPNTGSTTTMIPQFIQDLIRRILPNHPAGENLNDAQFAQLLQHMELEGDAADDDIGAGRNNDLEPDAFADPNGYGPNRGIDEPEQEGNAGRR